MVQGDVRGIVSQGDHSINVLVEDGRLVEADSLLDLPLREPRVLTAPARLRLFGRDELVERVVAQLTDGTSVQLYGSEGVGKNAIAEAVHRRLAARGQRGHVVRPRPGEEGSLDALYTRLATAFFGRQFLRPVDETELCAAVAGVRDVHVTVIDSTLGRDDIGRLCQTFPGCTFLFTSPHLTLPDTAGAHHVPPMGRDAAIELLNAELGLRLGPVGLRNLQFDHAYRMAEGKPQRLRLYAEFIKGMDEWRARPVVEPHDEPPPVDPEQLSPVHQAETLAVALSEPARRVLVALATFGVPLSAAWFAPVTGHEEDAEAGPELFDQRLATRVGDAYLITQDAAAAVQRLGWAPVPAATAAEGLLAALASDKTPPGTDGYPDPYLFPAVARALNDAREWKLSSRFVRTVVPLTLTSGAPQAALRLYALGRTAALRGNLGREHSYHLHAEEQTRNLLEGDRAAVAAALVVVLSAPLTPTVAAAGGKAAGFFGKVASAVTTKVGATVTAVTVAAAVAGGVVVATSGDGKPAGCDEALAANSTLRDEKPRTYPELAADYRQSAASLDAAAETADDAEVASTLRSQADDFTAKADEVQNKSMGPDVHPDVLANMVNTEKLSAGVGSLRAISQVCPLE
ncbi:hypothetical protein ACWV95_29735 [Streptomyces albus]